MQNWEKMINFFRGSRSDPLTRKNVESDGNRGNNKMGPLFQNSSRGPRTPSLGKFFTPFDFPSIGKGGNFSGEGVRGSRRSETRLKRWIPIPLRTNDLIFII